MENRPAGDAPLSPGAAATAVLRALEGRAPAVTVLLLSAPSEEEGSGDVGGRLVVTLEHTEGKATDSAFMEALSGRARTLLVEGGTKSRTEPVPGPGGPWSVHFEPHRPPPRLLVVGAGHIAQPLCRVGALLGLQVHVLDDRPDFATRERFPEAAGVSRVDFTDPFRDLAPDPDTAVVLVTRGHKYDYEALRLLLELERPPAYIGMIGSRRRVRATYVRLLAEGYGVDRLRTIRAPVGLDLGAETPAEIAVAVAAEIVLARRGGSGRPLVEVERITERFFKDEGGDGGE